MATGRWFVCAGLTLFANTFSSAGGGFERQLDNKSLAIKPDDVRNQRP